MNRYSEDRFDAVPRDRRRAGAHRAENPRMRTGLLVLWAAVAAVVLFLVGVFGTLAITGRLGFLNPEPAATTPAATVAATIDTSYRVLVLNAAADPDKQQSVRTQLIGAGWAEDAIDLADAAETTFPTTTVYYAEAADEAAARGLADLVGATLVIQDATYAQVGGGDRAPLTVVIGVDATPAP